MAKAKKLEWNVKITAEAMAVFQGKDLSDEDRVVITSWAELVRAHGPEKLQERQDIWNDHELERSPWIGHRASNYSFSGRIIYQVDGKVVTVTVVRITADHNYKKEKK